VLVMMAWTLGRLTYPFVQVQNAWYHASVVTGATSEEALQIFEDLQHVNSELFLQVNQFAQAEMLNYLPYILLVSAILLAGGVISTLFIWRSVIIPDAVSETIRASAAEADESSAPDSLASLLDNDGELVTVAAQDMPQQRREERA